MFALPATSVYGRKFFVSAALIRFLTGQGVHVALWQRHHPGVFAQLKG
jgi:hypothetical protein